MNVKRIISILLIGAMALTVVGCGNSKKGAENNKSQSSTSADTTVTKEEAFTTIPENKLVEDYVKNPSLQDKTLLQDGEHFLMLYYNDKPDNDLIKKYNLDYTKDVVYKSTDIANKYPELFEIGMNSLYTQMHEDKETTDTFLNKTLGTQIINYLSNVWMNEKNDGYSLADEFKEKNPKDTFQNYLKDNNIKISNITYPEVVKEYKKLTGTDYVSVNVTIKGTQNKKDFEKKIRVGFYFVPNKDIRMGTKTENNTISNNDFEIRAVYLTPKE